MSSSVKIGAGAVLQGPIFLGDNVLVGANACIGQAAEHRKCESNFADYLVVRDNTIIREGCVIHRSRKEDQRQTAIGKDCFLMNRCHVSHGSVLHNDVTMSSGSTLAGEVTLMQGCNLGMNVSVHQFVTIGHYCMVGMGAAVTNDVPPGWTVVGVPARLLCMNAVGLKRAAIGHDNLERFGLQWLDLRRADKRDCLDETRKKDWYAEQAQDSNDA